MDLLRLVFGLGVVFLGGVAVFMGIVMLIAMTKSGQINVSMGTWERTIVAAESPDDFRWAIALGGVLPVVAGAAAIYGGRRILRG